MALGLGLLSLLGGYAKGREQHYLNQLQQQNLQEDRTQRQQDFEQNLAESQREFDAQQNSPANQLARKQLEDIDAEKTFGASLPPPPKPPADWTKTTPEQRNAYYSSMYAYYTDLAAKAQGAGQFDIADKYRTAANNTLLAYQRDTSGQLNVAKIDETKARAGYYEKVLGVNLEIAKMKVAQADRATQARATAAANSAAARVQGAQISGEARIIAGYLTLQGQNERTAADNAVKMVQSAERYAASAGQPGFNPAAPGAQWSPPPISVQPGGTNVTVNLGDLLKALKPLPVGTGNGGGGAGSGNGAKPPQHTAAQLDQEGKSIIDAARKAHKSDGVIRAQMVNAGYDAKAVDDYMRANSGGSAIKPLPVSNGPVGDLFPLAVQ